MQVDVLDLFRMVDQAANGALTATLPQREIRVLLKGKLAIADTGPNRQHTVVWPFAPAALAVPMRAAPPALLTHNTSSVSILHWTTVQQHPFRAELL